MKQQKGLVSAIIPTLNRKEDLIKCIKSLKNNTYKKIEIIVSDNGSTDGTEKTIKKLFPEVILLRSEFNLGSPKALNKCIKKAKGEFILRLDNDVILKKDCIKKMIDVLKNKNKAGAISALYFYTQTPNILRSSGSKVNMITGKTTIFDRDEEYDGRFDNKIIERPIVSGCTMLAKRALYDEIGLFDESYFLSYDETDWCTRLLKKGYKNYMVGSTKVYHKKGKPCLKEDPFRVYLGNRSKVLFMKKNSGARFLFFLPYLLIFLYPAKVLIFLFKRNFKAISSLTKGILEALFYEKVFIYTKDGKKIYQ